MNIRDWTALSEAYAFIGNSLLLPMSQTADLGADPAFWEAFPDLGSERVRAAADGCAAWARRAGAGGAQAAVHEASVEHTRLFAGPPRPAAAPWETFHRGGGEVSVGFGRATAEMRALLREAGLEVSGPSNQYADHMGIELLLLSELCRHAGEAQAAGEVDDAAAADEVAGASEAPAVQVDVAVADADASTSADADDAKERESVEPADYPTRIAWFINAHPLGWIERLLSAVEADSPDGYIANLLKLEEALLAWTRDQIQI